jgi:hypothetical protein
MKNILLSLLLLVVGSGWLGAQAATKQNAQGGSARDRYEALAKEHETALNEFRAAYSKARTDAEKEKLTYPQAESYASRFLALAEENPKDSAALDALVWIATNCHSGKERETSLELLLKHHAKSPRMTRVAQSLIYSERASAEPWLRSLLKEVTDHEVKGWGTYALGRVLRAEDRSGQRSLAEAEKLFEEVAAKYGDVKAYEKTLADSAKGELFELRNLAVGQTAPEIEGQDVEGKKFKLSDYRGKVVVIDFWGDW